MKTSRLRPLQVPRSIKASFDDFYKTVLEGDCTPDQLKRAYMAFCAGSITMFNTINAATQMKEKDGEIILFRLHKEIDAIIEQATAKPTDAAP